MTETVTQAVARKEDSPGALIKQYSGDFASVLPSHIRPETWVRLAQGALKKGKRIEERDDPNFGQFELDVAARNNPGVFLAALLDAARLGLEPGTEQYYLTPRKVKGRLEILGIVGYQGHIELMYRAGAISSVVAEVVRTADAFAYRPGRDEIPIHEIDWDATDRGALRLVYAYARMKDGGYSRVIVLNRGDIERIKASAQGAKSSYSPWQTHEEAMWLKSAVRRLQKWVPTSAEYRREIARASAEAARVAEEKLPDAPPIHSGVDPDDVIDGSIVEPDDSVDSWPTPAEAGGES